VGKHSSRWGEDLKPERGNGLIVPNLKKKKKNEEEE
jgi:hypothetical protein